MFFTEEQMKKKEKEAMKAEAEREFLDFIGNMLLESDSIPERDKLAIKVVRAAQEVGNAIHDHIVIKYAKPGAEADEETLKQVVEYLALVKTGIMQFTKSTPLVKKEEN
ncbi:MAG: hypothetical protein IKT56_04590 [Clostridia bacterium]|nr:hypothetical protein [Clostridia bacterium]